MEPFVWSTDRKNSYVSFYECYIAWWKKAAQDTKIDLRDRFGIVKLLHETNQFDTLETIEEIIAFKEVEDQF